MAEDFMIPSSLGHPSDRPVNIRFEHIATGNGVEFFAWITNFSDTYTSNWNSQELYGRMDPMMTFKNTSRKITLDWDVVAASYKEAKLNMAKISQFIQMQYPTYSKGTGKRGGGGASMIGSPPLIRAKFLNWIGAALNNTGLVCALGGVTFKPNLEHGTFSDAGGWYPQSFALSVEMTILHEHDLGYHEGQENKFGSESFPYNAPTLESLGNKALPPMKPGSPPKPKANVDTPSEKKAGEDAVTGKK